MHFEELAQQLVQTASTLLNGRIVNIMDTQGIIVASTEAHRIGTRHEGACQVLRTRRPVAIHREELALYPGAKEGYNLPVWNDGQLIAVVGIFGNPDDVRDSAHILAAYTEQFFRQHALDQRARVTGELRTSYLRMVLSDLPPNASEQLNILAEALNLHLRFPVRVLALCIPSVPDPRGQQQFLDRAVEELLFRHLVAPCCDVWAIIDDRLMLLKSESYPPVSDPLAKMVQALEQALGRPVRLCAGSPCTSVRQIHRAGAEASILCTMDRSGVLDIQDAACRFFYLMQRASNREAGFIDDMLAKLARQFGDKELEVLLTTARTYYDCQSSVAQAAALLHIHKNTLQYRMHRLWDALCPGDASPFEREYLLRLCIMRGLHP